MSSKEPKFFGREKNGQEAFGEDEGRRGPQSIFLAFMSFLLAWRAPMGPGSVSEN